MGDQGDREPWKTKLWKRGSTTHTKTKTTVPCETATDALAHDSCQRDTSRGKTVFQVALQLNRMDPTK